jgi:hypothetical protein
MRVGQNQLMRHPSTRELFDYWNERRGSRFAPERADIEPDAIRRVLADTFILSFDPDRGHPFRIAGTRVCALFGRELRDEDFLNLWSAASRNDTRTLLTIVADESIGVVANVGAISAAEAGRSFELLLLPLRHHGQADARVLGALVPNEPPPWPGTHVLTSLTVGTHRYVGPGVADPIRAPTSPMPHGRRRHGLLVYDGGQA